MHAAVGSGRGFRLQEDARQQVLGAARHALLFGREQLHHRLVEAPLEVRRSVPLVPD